MGEKFSVVKHKTVEQIWYFLKKVKSGTNRMIMKSKWNKIFNLDNIISAAVLIGRHNKPYEGET